ncbi:hypothetical protein PABY_21270 [Pyrodictium abyssi]|uniref:AAA+ ATPase domain-containing protein n=2 Tax=Pyrodictium abyssi TaxID=54256 RepID=A0ABM8J0S9_9CREN|nr:hypothetical protein PABY_21270 [Pyrodictium abyssi]
MSEAEARELEHGKEDLLLSLLEEPGAPEPRVGEVSGAPEAPEEPAGDVEELTSVEPEEVLEEPGEAGGQEAGESASGTSGILEYSVGVLTVVVSEDQYEVVEPRLDPDAERALHAVVEYLAKHGLGPEKAGEAAEKLGLASHAQRQPEAFRYYVEKALSPWGFLYPLILDPHIEEISVVAGRPVDVIHRRLPGREYIPTNIAAPPERELREYVQRLAAAAGTAVSPAFPIAEAELDGHRVTIVLGSIASATSLSVRKHPEKPLGLEDLIADGMLSREAAEYLLLVLLSRGMVFIVGPQGTGKTTLLNALMEKLPQDWKLVAIEDVPELRPRHPRFISLRVRRARSLAASRQTEVTYQDLVRVALRLRGQFTAITEARGEEILDLFEVAALGEASAATFHARDWRELKLRLLKLGVREDMLVLLWSVVVLSKVRLKDGRTVRRVVAIYEVEPDGSERLLFRYDPEKDVLVKVAEPRRITFSPLSESSGDRSGGGPGTGSGPESQEGHNAVSASRDGSVDAADTDGNSALESASGSSGT